MIGSAGFFTEQSSPMKPYMQKQNLPPSGPMQRPLPEQSLGHLLPGFSRLQKSTVSGHTTDIALFGETRAKYFSHKKMDNLIELLQAIVKPAEFGGQVQVVSLLEYFQVTVVPKASQVAAPHMLAGLPLERAFMHRAPLPNDSSRVMVPSDMYVLVSSTVQSTLGS